MIIFWKYIKINLINLNVLKAIDVVRVVKYREEKLKLIKYFIHWLLKYFCVIHFIFRFGLPRKSNICLGGREGRVTRSLSPNGHTVYSKILWIKIGIDFVTGFYAKINKVFFSFILLSFFRKMVSTFSFAWKQEKQDIFLRSIF